jgi:hypothetical protein
MFWRRIAMMVSITALALLLPCCAGFGAALHQDLLPAFRWDVHIATRHILIIRYGRFHQLCYLNGSRPRCDPPEPPARKLTFLVVTRGQVHTAYQSRSALRQNKAPLVMSQGRPISSSSPAGNCEGS